MGDMPILFLKNLEISKDFALSENENFEINNIYANSSLSKGYLFHSSTNFSIVDSSFYYYYLYITNANNFNIINLTTNQLVVDESYDVNITNLSISRLHLDEVYNSSKCNLEIDKLVIFR